MQIKLKLNDINQKYEIDIERRCQKQKSCVKRKHQHIKTSLIKRLNKLIKGEIHMSQIDVNENDLKEITKKQRQSVIDNIKNIEGMLKYTPNPEYTPYQSEAVYKEEREIDSEDILNKAQKSLEAEKHKTLSSVAEKFDKGVQSSEEKKNAVSEEYLSNISKLENSLDEGKENALNNAVNKGVARSSILDNSLQEIDVQGKNMADSLLEQKSLRLGQIQEDLKKLENERDNALKQFEIEYAIKLQANIDKLTQEVEKYNEDVREYNKKQAEADIKKQKEHERDYQKAVEQNEKRNREVLEMLKSVGIGAFEATLQRQKMDMIYEFVDALSKEDALEMLMLDDQIKELLGEDNFNKVLSYVQDKKD